MNHIDDQQTEDKGSDELFNLEKPDFLFIDSDLQLERDTQLSKIKELEQALIKEKNNQTPKKTGSSASNSILSDDSLGLFYSKGR